MLPTSPGKARAWQGPLPTSPSKARSYLVSTGQLSSIENLKHLPTPVKSPPSTASALFDPSIASNSTVITEAPSPSLPLSHFSAATTLKGKEPEHSNSFDALEVFTTAEPDVELPPGLPSSLIPLAEEDTIPADLIERDPRYTVPPPPPEILASGVRNLIIIFIWWDSKARKWRWIILQIPLVVNFMRWVIWRDLGLYPFQYQLYPIVVQASGMKKHSLLPVHSQLEDEQRMRWLLASGLLGKAYALCGIGSRGLGFEMTSLDEELLSQLPQSALILLTRGRGLDGSYKMSTSELRRAIHVLLVSTGVRPPSSDVPAQLSITSPYDFLTRISRNSPQPGSLSPASEVALDMVIQFSVRSLHSFAGRAGNILGNKHRNPVYGTTTRAVAEVGADGISRPVHMTGVIQSHELPLGVTIPRQNYSFTSTSNSMPKQLSVIEAPSLASKRKRSSCTRPGCNNDVNHGSNHCEDCRTLKAAERAANGGRTRPNGRAPLAASVPLLESENSVDDLNRLNQNELSKRVNLHMLQLLQLCGHVYKWKYSAKLIPDEVEVKNWPFESYELDKIVQVEDRRLIIRRIRAGVIQMRSSEPQMRTSGNNGWVCSNGREALEKEEIIKLLIDGKVTLKDAAAGGLPVSSQGSIYGVVAASFAASKGDRLPLPREKMNFSRRFRVYSKPYEQMNKKVSDTPDDGESSSDAEPPPTRKKRSTPTTLTSSSAASSQPPRTRSQQAPTNVLSTNASITPSSSASSSVSSSLPNLNLRTNLSGLKSFKITKVNPLVDEK